jgi:hypothetical protein
VKRWFKMPCLMHQRGYITLPASARGVLVTIKELLSSEPELSGNMNAYFRWTGVDRHTLKKSFEALAELGLLRIEYDEKGEITITDPTTTSTKVDHELPQSSTKVAPNLSQGCIEVTPNLAQGCTKVTPNLTTQESSNDAGLMPAKTPLEENRIEENRKEKKRKEEKSAPVGAASAEPPSHYGSLTLEEAQQVIVEYETKYPYRKRWDDKETGQPISDMDWGHAILMVWKPDRFKELGCSEKQKDQPSAVRGKPEEDSPEKVTLITARPKNKTAVARPDGCDERVWLDWLRVRGRNPLTETAWAGMVSEAAKAGITPAEAVRVCAERGWRGFRAEWMTRDDGKRPGGRKEYDLNAMKFEPVYTADGEVSTNPADYW